MSASADTPTDLDADLVLMRAHDQRDWSPRAVPAMQAARRVFERVHLEGRKASEVVALIGEPMTKSDGGAVWEYAFHDGEVGVIRRVHVVNDRVTQVDVLLTQ